MRRAIAWGVFPLLVLVFAGAAPQAGEPKFDPKKPDSVNLTVKVEQSPTAVSPGQTADLAIALELPKGIQLNKYPGVTLAVDKAPGFEPIEDKPFAGSREPIEDLDDFYFETFDPLRLSVTPRAGRAGKRSIDATLSYFYCVKKSGFCAPRKQKVTLNVDVGSTR